MRNAMPPAASEPNEMYAALLEGLRAAEKTRSASVTATWSAIVETSVATVRPPRMAK